MQKKEKTHVIRFLKPAAAVLALVLIASVSLFLIQGHTGGGEAQRKEAVQKDIRKHVEALGEKVSAVEEKEDGVYEVTAENGKGFRAMVFNTPTRYADARCICLIDKNARAVADSWIFPTIYEDAYYTRIEEVEDGMETLVLASATTGGAVCTWDIEKYLEKLDMETDR